MARKGRVAGTGRVAGPSSVAGKDGVARTGTPDLTDVLARWLPQQRWFPGRGTGLSELVIVSDVTLRTGDPALRHLIVETMLHGEPGQVPGACRVPARPSA